MDFSLFVSKRQPLDLGVSDSVQTSCLPQDIVKGTLYTVQCILYSVHCTVYSVQFTVYSVQDATV